ncbi:MAG: hypothetical protein K0S38_33 [Candidatus Paceibacter sp.]|jgi:hypothetical protein|nr:hypothetical protein [Candidatus Paceibacter sp.]
MNPNYDRIKTAVNASTLPPEDKTSLINMFADIADENLIDIANLLNKDPQWIEKFNENRKMKIKAATSNDPSVWQELLEQEKKYLNDLTYGLD